MRKLLVACLITGVCAAFFIAGFMFQKAGNAERDGYSSWSKRALFSFLPADVCAADNHKIVLLNRGNQLLTRA